jgi:hypothetical protein
MNKRSLLAPILLFISYCSFSQGVGIGTTTPDASAALDITHPAKGLLVYDSVANQLIVNIGMSDALNFQPRGSGNSNGNGWSLTGNGNINPLSNNK